jgi:phthalate 4,5-cis-dihydrodiol dehydrogenase
LTAGDIDLPEKLRLGVIGLGRAFTLMLPTFTSHPKVSLTAATDPRNEAVARFASEFGAKGYTRAEELCADQDVQAIYVASPHQFHVAHVKLAAAHGKHVVVEKPMALSVAECQEMIAVAKQANIHLLVGHSHSFDLPYLKTRELILTGAYGPVRMITALNYTDFLYRPRRPEELDTSQGGGVVFSQAAHQVDVTRLLALSEARSVYAFTGRWDPHRPTEGAYQAQIAFADCSASLTYSGYAHFDSDEFNGWHGELGQLRNSDDYGRARRSLRLAKSPEEEVKQKNQRAYGPSGEDAFRIGASPSHNHFGLFIVSCEQADLRPTPDGIIIYGDSERRFEPLLRPEVPRAEVINELYDAVFYGKAPLHSGEWGCATLEILAILESTNTRSVISLSHQI